jgi:hypothetical protein
VGEQRQARIVAQVDHYSPPLLPDARQRGAHRLPAPAPGRTEHVTEQALALGVDRSVPAITDVADDERHVLMSVQPVAVADRREPGGGERNGRLRGSLDDALDPSR